MLGYGCAQAPPRLDHGFAGLWFFLRLPPVLDLVLLGCGYVDSSPSFCIVFSGPGLGIAFAGRGVIMQRLFLVLVLPLLGCGSAQASPSLGLFFAGLWLCIDFPWFYSCVCLAVVVNWLPLSWSWKVSPDSSRV